MFLLLDPSILSAKFWCQGHIHVFRSLFFDSVVLNYLKNIPWSANPNSVQSKESKRVEVK